MFLNYDEIKVNREDLDAVLFRFDETEIWIPKSLVIEIDEDQKLVDITKWFVLKNDLEYYEA